MKIRRILRKVRRYKKTFLILAVVCILTLIIPIGFAHADAADPSSAMLPDMSSLFNGQDKSVYLTTYRPNYYLDLKTTGFFKSFDLVVFNGLANGLFVIQSDIAYVVIIIVYYSYQISFVNIFGPILNPIVNTLQSNIFSQLSLTFISLLGIYYVIKMIQNQKTQIWVAILETIIVIALSTWFFNNPTRLLTNVDNISKEISQNVLQGTFQATNSGKSSDSAVMEACNSIWVMLVHKPWQVLEFGSVKVANDNEKKILSLSPGSDERQKDIDALAKDGQSFVPMWGLKRLGMEILYTVPLLIESGVMILLSALVLVYQFLAILLILMVAFLLLIALIPFWGIRAIKGWASKFIGYETMKIIMSFFIAVMCSFIMAIYNLTDKLGWFVTEILSVLVVAAIWWKREDLIDLITGLRHVMDRQPLHKHVNKETNLEQRVKNRLSRKTNANIGGNIGSTIIGNRKNGTGSSAGVDDSNDINNKNKGAAKNINKGNKSTYGANKNTEPDEANTDSNIKNDNDKGLDEGRKIKLKNENDDDKKYETENENRESRPLELNKTVELRNSSKLNNMLKLAEEILENQYENSKKESENKAKATGNEPQYSYFVKSAMNRQNMNLPKFDERQKMALVDNINRIQEAGGNPREILKTPNDTSENEIERPSLNISGDEANFEQEKVPKEINPSELTDMFNKGFNKNYDPKFMSQLSKKYGGENVKETLDRMQKINEREKINNAAGYLTQSLKNNASNNELRGTSALGEEEKKNNIDVQNTRLDTMGKTISDNSANGEDGYVENTNDEFIGNVQDKSESNGSSMQPHEVIFSSKDANNGLDKQVLHSDDNRKESRTYNYSTDSANNEIRDASALGGGEESNAVDVQKTRLNTMGKDISDSNSNYENGYVEDTNNDSIENVQGESINKKKDIKVNKIKSPKTVPKYIVKGSKKGI